MQQETTTVRIAAFQRSGRFFHATSVHQNLGGWYFSTREGIDYGPYLSVAEAQQHCEAYVRQCVASNIHGERNLNVEGVPAQYQKSA